LHNKVVIDDDLPYIRVKSKLFQCFYIGIIFTWIDKLETLPIIKIMAQSAGEPLSGTWLPTYLKTVHYGPGSVEKHLLASLPSENSKAFIITGNSLATKTHLIKQVEKLLNGTALDS
jgi:hypothetical protein